MKYERGSFITVASRDTLRGLHPTSQALYMWLSSYANETNECFPSRKTLAEDVGCSEDTIDKMLLILIESGLVQKKPRFNGKERTSNLYTVVIVGGSRQKRPPSPPETAGVAARNGSNSNQLTQTIEGGANEDVQRGSKLEDLFKPAHSTDEEPGKKAVKVIPSPYSIEATKELWAGGERRLQVLNWFLTEKGLWIRATNKEKLKSMMLRHNNSAVRIAKADWSPRELKEAKVKMLLNERMEDEWTLETIEKYLTK